MKRTTLLSVSILLALTLLLAACGHPSSEPANPASPTVLAPLMTATPVPVPTAVPTPEPTPAPYTTSAELVAVGDIMMHSPQITGGYDAATKTYSFDEYFTQVKDILSRGDWITANLETTLAGPDAGAGYTGYPEFNSPDALADALKAAGFNIITTANNHSLDRREAGIVRTLDILHDRGFATTGTAATPEAANEILIVRKNEIDMAFLAYTYGTNGIPVPAGKDYLVSLTDEGKMAADIQRAKQMGADIVTIALHFGDEYHREPNQAQKKLVMHLINAGADIILGSHPHVVEPYQILDVQSANGGMRKAVVIYSLGNFISNMTDKYTNIGLILSVKIEKSFPEGKTVITDVETIPTWVQQYRSDSRRRYRILPMQQTIDDGNDPLLTAKDYAVMQRELDDTNALLNSMSVPVNAE